MDKDKLMGDIKTTDEATTTEIKACKVDPGEGEECVQTLDGLALEENSVGNEISSTSENHAHSDRSDGVDVDGNNAARESIDGPENSSTRQQSPVDEIFQGLHSSDEELQLLALIEMSQMFLIGEKAILRNFPVTDATSLLIHFLSFEHNEEIMIRSCKALTYMMEALPGSIDIVAGQGDAIRILLQRLKAINYIDIAEESIKVLEILAWKHAKTILHQEGIMACLGFLDFFPLNTRLSALSIVAQCVKGLNQEEFQNHVAEYLTILIKMLEPDEDDLIFGMVAIVFENIVDSGLDLDEWWSDGNGLQLIEKLHSLLSSKSKVIGSTTTRIVNIFTKICSKYPKVAVQLMKSNIIATISGLIISKEGGVVMEILGTRNREILAIFSLIFQLIPNHGEKTDGGYPIFGENLEGDWEWQDDLGEWNPYTPTDNRIMEAGYLSGKDVIRIAVLGTSYVYTINTTGMQQVNETTGKIRRIRRITAPHKLDDSVGENAKGRDDRFAYLELHPHMVLPIIKLVFCLLTEHHNPESCPGVKGNCLAIILKVMPFLSDVSLENELDFKKVANILTSLLGSENELQVVIQAFQVCCILMKMHSNEFRIHFRREGVFHEISRISLTEIQELNSKTNTETDLIESQTLPELINIRDDYESANEDDENVSETRDDHESEDDEGVSQTQNNHGFSNEHDENIPETRDNHESENDERAPQTQDNHEFSNENDENASETRDDHKSEDDEGASQTPDNHGFSNEYDENIPETRDNHESEDDESVPQTQDTHEFSNENDENASETQDDHKSEDDEGASQTPDNHEFSNENDEIASETRDSHESVNKDDKIASETRESVEKNTSINDDKVCSNVTHGNTAHPNGQDLGAKLNLDEAHENPASESCSDQAERCEASLSRTPHKLNIWLKEQCLEFLSKYCLASKVGAEGQDALGTGELFLLAEYVEKLKQDSTMEEALVYLGRNVQDLSCFEIINSKLIPELFNYLTNDEKYYEPCLSLESRWHLFVQTFSNCPKLDVDANLVTCWYPESMPLSSLVERLNSCLSQLERFSNSSPSKPHPTPTPTPTTLDADTDESSSSYSETKSLSSLLNKLIFSEGITIDDPSMEVISLLNVINTISGHWTHLYPPIIQLGLKLHGQARPLIPDLEFNNLKMSLKARRALEVSSSTIPEWLKVISRRYRFLFPFEIRQSIFYIILLGCKREGLKKRMVTSSRENILDCAKAILLECDPEADKSPIFVQFEHEEGFGLGPTLEFYTLVSQEMQKKCLKLWHEDHATLPSDTNSMDVSFVTSKTGLFPQPWVEGDNLIEILENFHFLGKLIAKAAIDMRMIDMHFSPAFYKLISNDANICQADIVDVDSTLAKSIYQLLITEDGSHLQELNIYFTLPGYPTIELIKDGQDVLVTKENIDLYLKLVCEYFIKCGVSKQIKAFKEGFDSVLNSSSDAFRLFHAEEFEMVFSGMDEKTCKWDVETLQKSCIADHGYHIESQTIQFLFEILSGYETTQIRKFLQFITGSPRLPIGGLNSLSPKLTIVRKYGEEGIPTDIMLPSVMTCANYLKLPNYSSIDVMRERLEFAIEEGQLSFHLS